MRRISSVSIQEQFLEGVFRGSIKVRGFRGYYITPALELISFTSREQNGKFKQWQKVKPYRKKLNGKKYGARWVTLMDNNGKKHNINFDKLLEKHISKQKLEKIQLGELY